MMHSGGGMMSQVKILQTWSDVLVCLKHNKIYNGIL